MSGPPECSAIPSWEFLFLRGNGTLPRNRSLTLTSDGLNVVLYLVLIFVITPSRDVSVSAGDTVVSSVPVGLLHM